MLSVKSVKKSFNGFIAVNHADLTVKKGEVVAVIGPNGAGKTTLFNLITGRLKADEGEIVFNGEKINGKRPYEICRKGVCRSYQVVNIFNRLTVFENVQVAVLSNRKKNYNLFSNARKLAVKDTRDLLDSVGLIDKAGRISGSLSHGDQKVLEIAISLGNRPKLLIMDEPTAGMSPEETEITLGLMKKLSDKMGLTILFCEHDMNLVFAIAHKIMVMQQGKSIVEGKPDKVKNSNQVKEAYLGGGSQCSK